MDISTIMSLLAVLVLVLANGFFVASEFSLVKVRRSRVEQLIAEGNVLARRVRAAQDRLDSYLAATQLGITISSLGLGWIGEPALAQVIEPVVDFLPGELPFITSHALAVAVAFAIITTLHIVLGELAPKTLALQRAEQTALVVAGPTGVFLFIFHPAIVLLNGLGNGIVRLLGLRPEKGEELVHTVEELKLLVTAGREAGVLEEVEEEIVEKALDFGERQVREVMVPRTEMTAIEADASLGEALKCAADSNHTRLPVYEGSIDQIVGLIHLKDLVRAIEGGAPREAPIRPLLRQAVVVPETATFDAALSQMRAARSQMAIVVDEYGGTAGLVSIENIVEELIGHTPTEYGAEVPEIQPQPDGSVILSGMLSVSEANEHLELSLNTEEYDTVGGVIFGALGRKAEVGDEVEVDGARFRVEALDGLRIDRVRLLPRPAPEDLADQLNDE
ncbi:MAG: HlyC/CorC family transporter [Chloroflexi bacterium]|nr:HlyC/CorC family transporter [Chloroflexota bacterium]